MTNGNNKQSKRLKKVKAKANDVKSIKPTQNFQ